MPHVPQTVQYYPGWDAFKALPLSQKITFFEQNGEYFHTIFAQQFTRKKLDELFILADHIRDIAKNQQGRLALQGVLADKRAMLFFAQPSTRTFLSFLNSCHILGVKTSEIRDTATSSEVKGESGEDTIRTFASYVDLIIMRHKEEGYAEKSAWVLNQATRPVPVINAGSGKDEHPSQALLDLYTIQRYFKNRDGIHGKTIAMVGDLNRGRTVRSLSQLLPLYQNVKIIYVAPDGYKMRPDILAFLKEKNVPVHETDDFKSIIPEVDVIYMTRLQDEYDMDSESQHVDYARFHFTRSELSLLPPHAIIMHPFPRRLEIEVSIDKDKRAAYWEQEVNGMWARSALITRIFRREHLVENINTC